MGWQGELEPTHILAQVCTHMPYPLLTCPVPYLLHKIAHKILSAAIGRWCNSPQGMMLYDGPYFKGLKTLGQRAKQSTLWKLIPFCHCILLPVEDLCLLVTKAFESLLMMGQKCPCLENVQKHGTHTQRSSLIAYHTRRQSCHTTMNNECKVACANHLELALGRPWWAIARALPGAFP